MKINVLVIFGGLSVEHEVSVISALQAIENIDRKKYFVIPIYISKEGDWLTGDDLFDIENYKDLQRLRKRCLRCELGVGQNDPVLKLHSGKTVKKVRIDVAFPILHGGTGEDGSIQGLFEVIGIPFVGSEVGSSAIAMDKVFAKQIMKSSGITTPDFHWFWYPTFISAPDNILQEIEELKFPVIVKPANLGSSIGIKKAKDRAELFDAIHYAGIFAKKIIVEKVIPNLRELNCSVVGDSHECQVSEIEEPISKSEILTYEEKYLSDEGQKGMGGASRNLPAKIPDGIRDQVQLLAKSTFLTFGLSGVVRIDMLLDDSSGEVYVNEVNTIPGSLSFYLWEPGGTKYQELIEQLISFAFKKWRLKKQIMTNNSINLFNLTTFGTKSRKIKKTNF